MGRLTLEEFAVFAFVIMNADHRTGSWYGCAQNLARQIGKSERWCQRALAALRQKGYLSGSPSSGRGQYWITVKKYDEKASMVTPSAKKASVVTPSRPEGVYGDTLQPQKASVVTPYQEVRIQEVRNQEETLLAPLAVCTPGFELFWEAYPKKVGKPAAYRAWLRHVQADDRWPEVIEGLGRWKESWVEEEFIPYPEKFLAERRWQDEVPAKARSKNEQRINRTLAAAKRLLENGPEVDGSARRALPD